MLQLVNSPALFARRNQNIIVRGHRILSVACGVLKNWVPLEITSRKNVSVLCAVLGLVVDMSSCVGPRNPKHAAGSRCAQ